MEPTPKVHALDGSESLIAVFWRKKKTFNYHVASGPNTMYITYYNTEYSLWSL